MGTGNLITRKHYQKQILRLLENENAAFIIGVRHSGKSCAAACVEEQIMKRAAENAAVLEKSLERAKWECFCADDLIKWFEERYSPGKRNLVFLDEPIHLPDWERAAEHIVSHPDVKLVITASNRRALSERFSMYREGRYDVVEMLPLSFEEFIGFHGNRETTAPGVPVQSKRYVGADGGAHTARDLLAGYMTKSALPIHWNNGFLDLDPLSSADGMYSSIVLHDILEVNSSAGLSSITDQNLLGCIITVLAKAMGRNVSATWVGKQTPLYLDRPSSTKTVESYMRALLSSHLFYMAERYDIKAGQKLKTLAKFYIVDMGIYRLIAGEQPDDGGRALENRVYFELLRRGYEVFNGKYGEEEVKFMAADGHDRVYIQTADAFRERDRRLLLSPLRKIKDNHPKVIIVNDTETRTTTDGILILNSLEFFMGAGLGRQRSTVY
ncbi:MAG: ATP-binding protein [Clostridia bacterium]|nr:ATP-binding protein [Clostridia bacterium]